MHSFTYACYYRIPIHATIPVGSRRKNPVGIRRKNPDRKCTGTRQMRRQNQCRNPTPKTSPKHPKCCRNSATFSRPKMTSKTTTELVSVEPSTWIMLYQGGVAKIASVHMDHVGACAMGGGGSMVRWYVALAMPYSACPPASFGLSRCPVRRQVSLPVAQVLRWPAVDILNVVALVHTRPSALASPRAGRTAMLIQCSKFAHKL